MRPRQRQYAGQNGASRLDGSPATTAGMAKSLTRSGLHRHGRSTKTRNRRQGRDIDARFRRISVGWHWAGFALLAAVAGLSQPARAADEWPTRDITFYVPYAPGGSTDPISRKYAELLEKQLKVKVIVENKPGASATIGTGAVIRAAPDGYTIGLGSSSSLAYQPLRNEGPGLEIGQRLPVDRQAARTCRSSWRCRRIRAGRRSMISWPRPRPTRAS